MIHVHFSFEGDSCHMSVSQSGGNSIDMPMFQSHEAQMVDLQAASMTQLVLAKQMAKERCRAFVF